MPTGMRTARCLVLGANGFIGNHLIAQSARAASDLGLELVASPPGLDIRNAPALETLLRDQAPDCVVHLAAISFVPQSAADPAETYEVNFIGTLNLLTGLARTGFSGRLLFVSSAETYGAVSEDELPIREERRFAPRTPYGVSKAAGELLCLQHSLGGKLDVRIARPFNIIGPGQSSRFAVSSFARQIAELERVGGGRMGVGNLDVTRDFVAIDDAIAALIAILKDGRSGEAYNICSGREISMSSLLADLVARARAPIDVHVDPAKVRPAEQRRVRGSFSKLHADTGWQPGVDMGTTLDAILAHWRGI